MTAGPLDNGWVDQRPTLLIADDDPVMRTALEAQLGAEFRVLALAADAEEAAALAAEHQPDLALIDVQMPAGGARTAVPEIVACSPDTCVVVLSSDESESLVRELLSAGALAYVRKGVTGSMLATTLARALKARPARPTDLTPA